MNSIQLFLSKRNKDIFDSRKINLPKNKTKKYKEGASSNLVGPSGSKIGFGLGPLGLHDWVGMTKRWVQFWVQAIK